VYGLKQDGMDESPQRAVSQFCDYAVRFVCVCLFERVALGFRADCIARFCSSKVMPLKRRLRLSRILRMVFTASNVLFVRTMADHLPRCPNLNQWIPVSHIHGIVAPNAIEVDNVPEIPTDEHIGTRQGGDGDVLGIDVLGASQNSFLDVPVGQLTGLLGEFHIFPVGFCHLTQDLADGNRSRFKLQASEIRYNNHGLPGPEKTENWTFAKWPLGLL
jgi:hypothetical protein